jgi:predicted small secreted protein
MKAATSQEIKQQLQHSTKDELVKLCLRLARFKKENKELLDYLLFQSHDLESYIDLIKLEIDEGFTQVNTSSVFLAKKTIRKILRNAKKYIRYTGSEIAEAEILMHYIIQFKSIKLPWRKTKVLNNIYEAQLKKIEGAIKTMHEDLQHDYTRKLQQITSGL